MSIAVTGASGYVGGVIARGLGERNEVVRLLRRPDAGDVRAVEWSFASAAEPLANMLRARNVTHVVHAAWDMQANTLAELQAGCIPGSLLLLEASRLAGAGFTFISTISAFSGARSAYGRAKLAVEEKVLAAGQVVLRPGLVWGGDGGMFGNLRRKLAKARIVPLIGDGSAPQYLLDEATLIEAVAHAAAGKFINEHAGITLADPAPVAFRDLVRRLAGHPVMLVPTPWRIFYAGFRTAEAMGLKLGFRSDSILSMVHQNPAPDFSAQARLGFLPQRAFET